MYFILRTLYIGVEHTCFDGCFVVVGITAAALSTHLHAAAPVSPLIYYAHAHEQHSNVPLSSVHAVFVIVLLR